MAEGVGDGTTVTFGTSGFAPEIKSVSHDGIERVMVDRTHLGSSGGKQFLVSSILDYGTMTLNINFDPNDALPVAAAQETITIDWAGSGDTWAFTGACASISGVNAEVETLMSATLEFKVSGVITGI